MRVVLMPTLVRGANSKKKPTNMEKKKVSKLRRKPIKPKQRE